MEDFIEGFGITQNKLAAGTPIQRASIDAATAPVSVLETGALLSGVTDRVA